VQIDGKSKYGRWLPFCIAYGKRQRQDMVSRGKRDDRLSQYHILGRQRAFEVIPVPDIGRDGTRYRSAHNVSVEADSEGITGLGMWSRQQCKLLGAGMRLHVRDGGRARHGSQKEC